MVVVVREAGEAWKATLLTLPLAFLLLSLLLPPPLLLEKLQFAVYFLSSFPIPREGIFFFFHDRKALSQLQIGLLL